MSSRQASEKIFTEHSEFKECHASSLIELPGDKYLIVWFAGTKEGHKDVSIWGTVGCSGNWGKPELLAKVEKLPHWNPVLFQAPGGTIHLFFKVGLSPKNWVTWVMQSEDEGRHWNDPHRLVPGDPNPRGPVKNKIIRLADSRWVAPASVETEEGLWDVFVDTSVDDGQTWQTGELLPLNHGSFPGKGVIQPTLWESQPGQVHMLMRSTCGRLCRADSRDGGRNWGEIYVTDLPNNNSGIDIVNLPDGRLVLAYNPVSGDWAPRTPLCLGLSEDNGLSWPFSLALETDIGEYSYPAVIEIRNGVAVTYTWKRQSIAFWHGSVNRILNSQRSHLS